MSIPFHCDDCGHDGTADDRFAGRRVKCPRCKSLVEIADLPGTRGATAMDAMAAMRTPPPANSSASDESAVPSTEAEWRVAMFREAKRASEDVNKIRGYVGCLLAIWIVSIVLGVFAAMIASG